MELVCFGSQATETFFRYISPPISWQFKCSLTMVANNTFAYPEISTLFSTTSTTFDFGVQASSGCVAEPIICEVLQYDAANCATGTVYSAATCTITSNATHPYHTTITAVPDIDHLNLMLRFTIASQTNLKSCSSQVTGVSSPINIQSINCWETATHNITVN